MCKKLINCFLFVLVVFLYSCEFELEETNFVELKKPVSQGINLTLNAPQNEKGEYLIRYPYVKYKLEIPTEYKNYIVRFSIDEPYRFYWNDNYIYFDYYYYDITSIDPFSLKCEIALMPDSAKSIAEISGYEYLEKTFEWKMVLDPQPAPRLNLGYEKIDDKTYRLTWKKPDIYYGEVVYYEVYTYNYQDGNFYDTTNELFYDVVLPDDTYYLEYRVTAYFKDGYISPLYEYNSIYINY
jgi:hypothetical protein